MSNALASRSRYIPWLFVAGFALVIAVNATMIWFAVGSFSGLYTPKPRDRGLHYNEVVAEQKARDALGWRMDAQWRAEEGRLDIAVFDAAASPSRARGCSSSWFGPSRSGHRWPLRWKRRIWGGSLATSTCRSGATGTSTSWSNAAASATR